MIFKKSVTYLLFLLLTAPKNKFKKTATVPVDVILVYQRAPTLSTATRPVPWNRDFSVQTPVLS